MTTTISNQLARDFLDQLRAASRDLPPRRRDELLDEIATHIAEALPPEATEGEIRDVLDRLGGPEQIAEEERDRLGIERPRAGALEWVTIVLLPIGGVIIPMIGWFVGIVLLWASRVWTTRDKLIGTLVVPGGLLPALFFLLAPASVSSESCEVTTRGVIACYASPTAAGRVLGIAVVIVLVVAPILTAIHLARRAQRASVGSR